jgi:4'-phosphopantetheinyl transferase
VSSRRALPAGSVEVWSTWLSRPPDFDDLRCLLASGERERAARFSREPLRVAYTVGRARLRVLLSSYLGVAAAGIELTEGRHGKPQLVDPEHRWLRFNLSHSDGLAVYAFVRDRDIGVDVERIDARHDLVRVGRRCYTDAERGELESYAGDDYVAKWHGLWTRKEAVLKAIGSGFSIEANRIEALPDRPVLSPPPDGRSWQLAGVAVAPGYAAAVAVERRGESAVAIPSTATLMP